MTKKALQALGVEDVEKSFNDSLDNLNALLFNKESIEKSKKAVDDEDSEKDEEDDDEDEADDDEKPAMKSVEDYVNEDPEASAAMDIEPFLRSLVKGIDEKFNAVTAGLVAMQKSIKRTETLNKAQAQLMVANAEMQKSMRETVEKIGETPIPPKGVMRKSEDRFSGSGESKPEIGRGDLLDKAMKLCREGKLTTLDVTKIEGRLNKGLELEEKYMTLLNK